MRLRIRQFGDPILRAKGRRIIEIDERIRDLASDMIETMHAANGVGLAAQQIGQPLQLTVIDVAGVEDRPSTLRVNGMEADIKSAMPMVLVNPQVVLGAEITTAIEGCLSFPEITADIERSEAVVVRAETLEGEAVQLEATGLLARALQHEADHLNGILFIDRMSSALKVSLSSRLKRLQKETERGERTEVPSLRAGQRAL
jgi:peptide deformylase